MSIFFSTRLAIFHKRERERNEGFDLDTKDFTNIVRKSSFNDSNLSEYGVTCKSCLQSWEKSRSKMFDRVS